MKELEEQEEEDDDNSNNSRIRNDKNIKDDKIIKDENEKNNEGSVIETNTGTTPSVCLFLTFYYRGQ